MYARQPLDRRPPPPLRIPRNYSGNAFPPKEEPPPPVEEREEAEDILTAEDTSQKEEAPAEKEASLLRPFGRKDRLSSGIGSEELLILGLILLTSQNDAHDDLLPLLLLLLLLG